MLNQLKAEIKNGKVSLLSGGVMFYWHIWKDNKVIASTKKLCRNCKFMFEYIPNISHCEIPFHNIFCERDYVNFETNAVKKRVKLSEPACEHWGMRRIGDA